MIFGLITFLFALIGLLLVLIILIQKGSSSMGLGNFGGSNLALFGGSGGQNIFQKITWGLGALFMGGSLVLAILKTQNERGSRYMSAYSTAAQTHTQVQQQAAQQPQESAAE